MSLTPALERSILQASNFRLVTSISNRSLNGLPGRTLAPRSYATHSSLGGTEERASRRQVTVASDDGRVKWGQLSTREKAARTTQQSFNFAVIVTGLVATV